MLTWKDKNVSRGRSLCLDFGMYLSLVNKFHIPSIILPKTCSIYSSYICNCSFSHAVHEENRQYARFVIGKTKVAPPHGHSIPRLELCSALLAIEIYQLVNENLNIAFENVKFYPDSRVVLEYITNQTRRFLIYFSNRVELILNHSTPKQWNYVPTELNPAEI